MSLWSRLSNALSRAPREAAESVFSCEVCGAVAATVAYVPPGETHPQAGPVLAETPVITVDGFLGSLSERVAGRARPLVDVLTATDARGLWRLDALWAPFYCPDCDVTYCQAHWATEVVFADDHPGWYEHTNGRCPKGHTRILDD